MKKRLREIVYTLIIGVCIACIGVSTVLLINKWTHRQQENQLIEEIKNKKQECEDKSQVDTHKQDEEEKYSNVIRILTNIGKVEISPKVISPKAMLPEYTSLYEENNDLYGWIKIEGTVIDYPVMFTPSDPNFYEDKNWNKEICYASVGTSIWVDGWTTEDSENTIIYGHDMADYSMFGSLSYYKDPSYYESHKYIQFDTLYEKQTYEIISVSKGVVYYDTKPEGEYLFYEHIDLDSEEEFKSYVDNAKQKGWYNINETAQYGDKLITLCTCDNWTTDGRLFIVAKKIDN